MMKPLTVLWTTVSSQSWFLRAESTEQIYCQIFFSLLPVMYLLFQWWVIRNIKHVSNNELRVCR